MAICLRLLASGRRVGEIVADAKGAIIDFAGIGDAIPTARKLHRSTRVREIASAHASQNLGPDFEKTAPKLRTDRGVITEAAEQDFFVRCVGPTAAGFKQLIGVGVGQHWCPCAFSIDRQPSQRKMRHRCTLANGQRRSG